MFSATQSSNPAHDDASHATIASLLSAHAASDYSNNHSTARSTRTNLNNTSRAPAIPRSPSSLASLLAAHPSPGISQQTTASTTSRPLIEHRPDSDHFHDTTSTLASLLATHLDHVDPSTSFRDSSLSSPDTSQITRQFRHKTPPPSHPLKRKYHDYIFRSSPRPISNSQVSNPQVSNTQTKGPKVSNPQVSNTQAKGPKVNNPQAGNTHASIFQVPHLQPYTYRLSDAQIDYPIIRPVRGPMAIPQERWDKLKYDSQYKAFNAARIQETDDGEEQPERCKKCRYHDRVCRKFKPQVSSRKVCGWCMFLGQKCEKEDGEDNSTEQKELEPVRPNDDPPIDDPLAIWQAKRDLDELEFQRRYSTEQEEQEPVRPNDDPPINDPLAIWQAKRDLDELEFQRRLNATTHSQADDNGGDSSHETAREKVGEDGENDYAAQGLCYYIRPYRQNMNATTHSQANDNGEDSSQETVREESGEDGYIAQGVSYYRRPYRQNNPLISYPLIRPTVGELTLSQARWDKAGEDIRRRLIIGNTIQETDCGEEQPVQCKRCRIYGHVCRKIKSDFPMTRKPRACGWCYSQWRKCEEDDGVDGTLG